MPVASNPVRARRSTLAIAIGAVLITSVAAAAETSGTLEEIVVTATKRAENQVCKFTSDPVNTLEAELK